MSTHYNRGNTELLECVVIARAVQAGERPWLAGCAAIADRILTGQVNPHDACTLLAEVSHSLNYPPELSALSALSHEQYDHEQFGFTEESCRREILEESRRLVQLAVG